MATSQEIEMVPPQGGYVAKQCPVRAQLDNDAHADRTQRVEPTIAERVRMDAGIAFETHIYATIIAGHPAAELIVATNRASAQHATLDAIGRGATVIAGADLPDDPDGRRTGRPDLLVRVPSDGPQAPRWLPVDVKHHRLTEPADGSTILSSHLDGQLPPTSATAAENVRFRHGKLRDDALQLAHYWRMLDHHSLAPTGPAMAGVIDRDEKLWWVDLTEPWWKLWWSDKLVSTLEWYDHEFAFRLDVIASTLERNADATLPRKVVPVWTSECRTCPWRTVCRTELEQDDHVSLLPGSTYDRWVQHRRLGTLTRTDVANLDPATAWVLQGDKSSDPKVDLAAAIQAARAAQPATPVSTLLGRKKAALGRLANAGVFTVADLAQMQPATAAFQGAKVGHLLTVINQARAAVAGTPWRARGVDKITVRRADVEVDVDMESIEDGVYLWGALVRRSGVDPEYTPFVTWEPLTFESEAEVFAAFWSWLTDLRDAARADGLSFAAYYYTSAENNQIRRILRSGQPDLPAAELVESFIDSDDWIDLHGVFTSQVVTGAGGGLKEVARLAGFSWRDDDPGGDQSTIWYRDAVDNPDVGVRQDNRARLLSYNEDDVLATLALRDWLSAAACDLPSIDEWRGNGPTRPAPTTRTGASPAPKRRRPSTARQPAPTPQPPTTALSDKIQELVARFERGRRTYTSAGYNETQVRREFIDPLFTVLGWDVDNTAGYAEAYKDVIHEDRLTIGGASKAPDYSFRIGGVRKFFVEAKKPSVNLHVDPLPAYQLRRYAWNAKLPLSIVTDFDEFAVYDCRHQPQPNDAASAHRLLYIRSDEYATRWSEIADVFSKEAVLLGSFDSYAVSVKGKRGTTEVDRMFLAEMEEWRQLLAKNLVLRNTLTQPQLNFAVQQTIDRIVFLRICEDRGIEPYGQLQDTLAKSSATSVYEQLVEIFKRADDRYNSGLFHFRAEHDRHDAPDQLTPDLTIDDNTLSRIIKRLYFPASPYDFKVLPAVILGQIYERFLGQVIRLTPSGRAVVEPKPEVRKAGGVYYTPTYVVEHIVDRTLGPLLAELNPRSASRLRVIDPASGSGSFLLVAYDRLLKWHLHYYENSRSANYRNRIYKGAGGRYYLTVDEKRRILLNNIFGVDIDSQAVEVTKLSLLLRVLEDENAETLAKQLQLFNDRALPDLDQNIKCGNSLIEPDYFDTTGSLLVEASERTRINAFSWEDEFPTVIADGGFDVVIGNPPYVFTREQFTPEERSYYGTRYPCGWEKRNTFLLFMELLQRLLRSSGRGGYIVPNSWLTIESAQRVRALYAERVRELVDLNYAVFEDAVVEPSIFVVDGERVADRPLVLRTISAAELVSAEPIALDRSVWERSGGRFIIPDDAVEVDLVDAVFANGTTIGAVFDVRTGLQAYEKGKGEPRQTAADVANHVYDRYEYEDEDSYRYLQGRDVQRYGVAWSGMWMQHGPWLSQPREIDMFVRSRVLLREITSPMPHCFSAAFTTEPFLSNKSVLTVLHHSDDEEQLRVLEAVLNSRLMSLCYRARAVKSARKIFPKVVVRNLRELPLPKAPSPEATSALLRNVDAMRAVLAEAENALTPRERDVATREHGRLSVRTNAPSAPCSGCQRTKQTS